MKLMFVRHGDPDYENDSLTPLGVREAEATAARLEGTDIAAFFISPLGRARKTAQATLDRRGDEGIVLDWLKEFDAPIHRPDKGGELAITWDWLPQDWLGVDEFYSIDTWLDAEVMQETDVETEYNKVCDGIDNILAEYGYVREKRGYRVERENTDTLCFFCHYGVTCVILSHLLNISPMLIWHGMAAVPASITILATEERRKGLATFRMNHYGDTAHLDSSGLGGNTNACFCEIYSDFSQRHD